MIYYKAMGLKVCGVQSLRSDRAVFTDVSFTVAQGEVMQITGINGCGKTSLLRIICGLLPMYEGQIVWYGEPVITEDRIDQDFLQQVIYLGHHLSLRLALTPWENIKFQSKLFFNMANQQQGAAALEYWGLSEHMHTPCAALSRGQCQRVLLSRLYWQTAALWLLDEPLAFLDAWGQQKLYDLIDTHVANNGIAIIVTHKLQSGYNSFALDAGSA